MKRFLLVPLILFSNVASSKMDIREDSQTKVFAPFGFSSNQPPRGGTVKIIDVKVGFKAQQTCGYTDWSTVQLYLPKELLSKQYWKNVGDTLLRQAKQAALDLAGSIPSMLTCNVSPTFCSLINHAEMMAAFESQLTFKTCEILDGLANTDGLQAEGLRKCINNQMSQHPYSSSKAREICLANKDGAGPLSKDKQADEIASNSGNAETFNMQKFIEDLFPEKVETRGSTYFNFGGPTYTRIKSSRRIMFDLFPGVELTASASFMRGGTFQPTIDIELANKSAAIKDEILRILKKMKELEKQGYAPNDIIAKSESLWMKKADVVPEIYRESLDGSEPVLIVAPEQMLMLLPMFDSANDINKTALRQVVERLSKSAASVKLTDNIADIYTRSLDHCRRNPKYQDAISQKNCKLILERAKSDLEILAYKTNAEEQARKVQVEISSIVLSVQAGKARRAVKNTFEDNAMPKGAIEVP